MTAQSVEKKVLASIHGHGMGWVFSPQHFSAIGSPHAVLMALMRLRRKKIIRRLARGLYDYPKQHPKLGVLAPAPDAVAHALAGRDAARVQPSGAYAANQLGLSDQVPMRVVFLTDGATRKIRIGKQEIVLKHTTPRNMATAGRTSGLVIQALRHLGQKHVHEKVVAHLRRGMSDGDKKQLLKDLRFAPAWVTALMRKIAEQ